MAFYSAHCDNNCDGCSQNNGCGWCIYWNTSIASYVNTTFSTTTDMFLKKEGLKMKTLNEFGTMTVRDLIDMLQEYDEKAYVTVGLGLHPIGVRERNGYVNIRVKYADQLNKEN